MPNDFNNVNMGAVDFSADMTPLGYSQEGSFSFNTDYWEFYADMPASLKLKLLKEFGVSATCKVYEITPRNQILAMGVSEDNNTLENFEGSVNTDYYKDITAWSGTLAVVTGDYTEPTTLNGYAQECIQAGTTDATIPAFGAVLGATITDGTAIWETILYGGELLTMSTYDSGSLNYVELEGYNLVTADMKVYNADYTGLYTVDTDFYIRPNVGLFAHPTAAVLGNGVGLNIIYSYTEIDKQRVNIKPENMVSAERDFQLFQRNPNTDKKTTMQLWGGQGQSFELTMPETEGSSMGLNIEGFEQSNRGGRGLGYLKIEV